MLEALEALVTKRDHEAALAIALEFWRSHRHPLAADVIDRLSRRVDRPSLVKKPLAEQWKGFRAVAAKKDPADLERLIAVPLPRKWTEAEPLIGLFDEWAHDPRFARWWTTIIATNAVRARSGESRAWQVRSFYARLLDRLVSLGDSRAAAWLAEVSTTVATVHEGWRSMLPETLAKLRRLREPGLDRASTAALKKALELLPERSKPRDTSELLDAVYAAPEEASLRAVLGDALAEEGDPRGEFIALQLAERRNESKEARLIAKHGEVWAAPIGSWFEPDGRVFEGGFFAGGRLRTFDRFNSPPAKVLAHPAWRLVTTLELGYGAPLDPLEHENLTFLKRLSLREARLAELPRREWKLEELVVDCWREEATPSPHPLWEARDFPKLEVLGVADPGEAAAVAALEWLPKAPVLRRLQRVIVDIYPQNAGPWLLALAQAPVPEVQVGRKGSWVFVLRRGPAGTLSRLEVKHVRGQRSPASVLQHHFVSMLNAIPEDGLEELIVEKSSAAERLDRAGVDQALTRFSSLRTRDLPWG